MPKAKTTGQQKKKLISIKIQSVSNMPEKSEPKPIFTKSNFSHAPGGNLYEWKEAETTFEVTKNGFFRIKIEASAKNAKQNKSTDDDDLRVALDGFDFGKYEHHEEDVSWKGFGASAAWNGASLKGGTKIIYFFTELQKGEHVLQFFADETPLLKNIEVFEVKDNIFEDSGLKPPQNIPSDENGVPWMSFIFLGGPPKNVILKVKTESGKIKGTKDGDNLKIVVNGAILKSPIASTAPKYKNFYFSGDLRKQDILTISHAQLSRPLTFENSIELWYDEMPEIVNLEIRFASHEEIIEYLRSEGADIKILKEQVKDIAERALKFFRFFRKEYSAKFLEHALKSDSPPLIFNANDPLAQKIKKDPIYGKILVKIKEKITLGTFNGEIWPEDFKDDPGMNGEINFDSEDFKTSIHGVRKIEYTAAATGNYQYAVNITIFDIYDFEKEEAPNFIIHPWKFLKSVAINNLETGEILGMIKSFEIEIHLIENIHVE